MRHKDFSLDYLYKKGSATKATVDKVSSIDKAVMLYSRPILDALQKSADHQAGLHDISRSTHINIKEIMQVMPKLSASGFIEVINEDTVTGNDLIRITDDGIQQMTG